MRAQRYLILGFAQLAVGAAAIFARFALSGAPPLSVAAARLTIAAAVLWLLSPLFADPDSRIYAPQRSFIIAGAALAAHFAAWIASLNYTSVAVSTLLVATTPVWTALYDAVVRRKNLSAPAWIAMAAGALGLFAVAGFNRTPAPLPGHQLLGCSLAIAGAIAIGAYFLIVREMRALQATQAIVTRTYSWAALALLIAAAWARQPPPPLSNAAAWGGIVAMALISQLLGHTAMNAALRWFSASAVAFTTLIEPVIAAVLAFFIFGERLTPAALAGAVLLLAAIAVFLREEARLYAA